MTTTVSIAGIHCASCAALIKDVSRDFPSIQSIDVDVHTKTAALRHDDHLDLAAWTNAIEALNDDYHVSIL